MSWKCHDVPSSSYLIWLSLSQCHPVISNLTPPSFSYVVLQILEASHHRQRLPIPPRINRARTNIQYIKDFSFNKTLVTSFS